MKRGTFLWYILTVVLCVVISGAGVLWSEDLKFPTTEEEIIKALSVIPPSVNIPIKGRGGLASKGNDNLLFDKPRTRGISEIVEDDEEALVEAPKVGALILFDYNSAVIKAESLPLLREYGKALQGALKDAVLIVAGHTDSIGSDKYNLNLSQRRAE